MLKKVENFMEQEKLSDLLKKIQPQVTELDRLQAQEELELSTATISNYLNGKVLNVDTAIALLKFFSKRIELRKEEITALEKKIA